MRRFALSLTLALIGFALVGGFLTQVVPDSLIPEGLRPLGLYVGTNGSVAGAIFGLGLIWASTNPRANIVWVVLWILYAVLLVLYQAYAGLVMRNPWELGPIIFGLLAGGLVAALYPTNARSLPAPPQASPAPSDDPLPAAIAAYPKPAAKEHRHKGGAAS